MRAHQEDHPMTDEELDRLVRRTIDPARQSDGGDGTMIVFGFETLYDRVRKVIIEQTKDAETQRLRDALNSAAATLLMARGLIDGPTEFNYLVQRTLDECRNALR
jgi:hypothetical protein